MIIEFCLLVLCFFASIISANTEKIVFVAPEAVSLSQSGPSLTELNLDALTPSQSTLRTSLAVTFPHETSPLGNQSWYILSGLDPGRRYEVRICWAATVILDSQARMAEANTLQATNAVRSGTI